MVPLKRGQLSLGAAGQEEAESPPPVFWQGARAKEREGACPAGSAQLLPSSFLPSRTVYRAQEEALSRSMELRRKTAPTEMGIPSKLLPKGEGPSPYAAAVQELLLLPLSSCPQRKLECIGEAW